MRGKDIIFRLALRSIRLHFLRSTLAVLGIVIGVVAIATMGMMGANMTLSVTEQLSDMGNVLVVTESREGGGGGMPGPGGRVIGLAAAMAEIRREIPAIRFGYFNPPVRTRVRQRRRRGNGDDS